MSSLSWEFESAQWRIYDLAKGGPWRARRARAYNGGLAAEPPAGSRGRAPGRGVRRAKPPEAKTLFAFERLIKAANSPIFMTFGNAENYSVISDAISHVDFDRILYRYEKRPLNIVEFCNSCWKTVKKRTFSSKVVFKIFMVGPKGGHRTVALPLNTPLSLRHEN